MRNVTIVGAGVVGQATGKGLLGVGNAVRFVDVIPAVIERMGAEGYDAVYPDQHDWNSAEITMLSVNTPTIENRIDLSNLMTAIKTVGRGLADGREPHTVVVRSTIPPTTTLTLIRPLLEASSGRQVGADLHLAFCPEFLRQARANDDFAKPWIHVIGAADEVAGAILQELVAPFDAPVVRTDPTTAETIKYAHNLYNATKISFFNEFHLVCERLGIDSRLVSKTVALSAEASWNPEYGIRGGAPYGGACLPKDTAAFLDFATRLGLEMPVLAGTIRTNTIIGARATSVGVPVFAPASRATGANGNGHAKTNGNGHAKVNGNGHAKTNGIGGEDRRSPLLALVGPPDS